MTKITHAVNIITNELVTVLSVSGGWTTVRRPNGVEAKARNSHFRAATEAEIVAASTEAVETISVTPVTAVVEQDVEIEKPVTFSPTATVTADLSRYTLHTVKSAGGRRVLDINDQAAALLRGHDISDCYFIVAKHMAAAKGEDRSTDQIETELTNQYAHLNHGMQRMNLGNRLRKVMGTYGNLNAHKSNRATDSKSPTKSDIVHEKVVYATPGETVIIKTDRRQQ